MQNQHANVVTTVVLNRQITKSFSADSYGQTSERACGLKNLDHNVKVCEDDDPAQAQSERERGERDRDRDRQTDRQTDGRTDRERTKGQRATV